MKRILFLCAMAFAGCARLPEAPFDEGGVTFDFARFSDVRFQIPDVGAKGNLITAKTLWRDGLCEIHRVGIPWDSPIRAEARKHVSWAEKDGVRSVSKDAGLKSLKGPGDHLYRVVSASWTAKVALPDAKGGTYRVSCRYQQRHTASHASYLGGVLIWFGAGSADGRIAATEKGRYECWQFDDRWGAWGVFSRTFAVAPGTDVLDLHVRMDGIGDMKFRDFGVTAVTPEKPISVKMQPHGLFDGTYAVAQGQAMMLAYGWKKSVPDAFEAGKFRFKLTLPPGLDYLGDSFAEAKTREVKKLPDGTTVVSFAPRVGRIPSRKYTGWDRFGVLVKTDKAPPWRAEGTLELAYGGRPCADIERTTFFAVEPVAAVRPKRFRNGVIFAGRPHEFGPAAEAEFARTMVAGGADWVIANDCTPERVALWRKAGISVVTPYSDFTDGYYLGYCTDRPKEDSFVSDGKEEDAYRLFLARSTCPMAVYEERPYFVTNTAVKLAAALKGTDGMWANWEPFMFHGHGCNCANCDAAYAKWHAKTGGTRAKFRSYQHGLMVKTIDKYVRAATGGEKSYGFIPGVSWREVCSAWRETHPAKESEPIDYAGSLKWLEPWGPYARWAADEPYNYEKRAPLAHFVVAKDMRATVDADFPVPQRPKLLSFPQGLQCDAWVTQPEHIEMACDSFFFNGFEANVTYFFPEGYDARYWKAFAAATTRAAKYEDFTWDGVRADRNTTLLPVPEYAAPCTYVTAYLPQYRDVSPLCQTTYEKDGARIVAVFNFWQKGEAYFTLRSAGLVQGDYVLFDEDGVLYPNCGLSRTWTADELARGVFLAVGASRTKVFEIRPVGRPFSFTSAHTQKTLRQRHHARKGALTALAAGDAAYEDANREERKDVKSEL